MKRDGRIINSFLGYIDVEFAGIACFRLVEAFREDFCNVPRSCTDLDDFGVSIPLLRWLLSRLMIRKIILAQKYYMEGETITQKG